MFEYFPWVFLTQENDGDPRIDFTWPFYVIITL